MNHGAQRDRHRLHGYLAQRVPSICLAGSLGMRSKCEVLKCIFPWGIGTRLARYALSWCRRETQGILPRAAHSPKEARRHHHSPNSKLYVLLGNCGIWMALGH